jgi:opacity protein-like surface antigen
MKKILAAAALACVLAAPAHAVTIFEDNFDSNPADQFNAAPSGWTTVFGFNDIIGVGGSYDWYNNNGSYIDLDGSRGVAGQSTTILSNTPINFTPGSYTVSFDYGINQYDSNGDVGDSDFITLGAYIAGFGFFDVLTVDAGALPHNGSGSSNNVYEHAILNFFLPFNLTAQLFFRGDSEGSSDQSGGIIDNVKLTQVSAVPLPGAALLLATGLLGLGGASRLRRKS